MIQRSGRTGGRTPAESDAAVSGKGSPAMSDSRHGQALRIPLDAIDEDPDQPRSVFDDAALESMAESIRMHGVVQPIGVRAGANGRYLLAFGARRLRASRLAGVADIPAVVWEAQGDEFAAQIIENQHRTNLANSDLAAAIARLTAGGSTIRQIAAICSLKDYQVTVFRQAENFPPELQERMDHADMRALYDLYRQWTRTPDALLAALPYREAFITVTDARRIVAELTGKPSGSIVLERERAEAAGTASQPDNLPRTGSEQIGKQVPVRTGTGTVAGAGTVVAQPQGTQTEAARTRAPTSHSRHQAVDAAPSRQQVRHADAPALPANPSATTVPPTLSTPDVGTLLRDRRRWTVPRHDDRRFIEFDEFVLDVIQDVGVAGLLPKRPAYASCEKRVAAKEG